MKNYCILIISVILLISAGCRREDYKTTVFNVPGLTESNTNAINEALKPYSAIDHSSIKYNLDDKTITMRYDSMKIAKMNIIMAIDEKNIEVEFPKKEGGPAGYINSRGN